MWLNQRVHFRSLRAVTLGQIVDKHWVFQSPLGLSPL